MRNGVESTGPTADADPGALDDDPLERIARKEILDALRTRLTSAELEAFEAALRDEDRRSFARRTGRSPQSVDVLWRRIREKAKKLRSQM